MIRRNLVFACFALMFSVVVGLSGVANAGLLYTNAGPISVDETGAGSNLAGMTVSRSSTASDTLYFKYIVDPTSDFTTENYFAGFNFYEGVNERMGVGNAFFPFAYSAYNTAGGNVDLNSSTPEPAQVFQNVRNTDLTTIVFKVKFNSGADDNVTAYLNPVLSQTEASQTANRITTFNADVTFDEIHLREGGGGGGWTFSDIRIAEFGTDPGFFAVPEPASLSLIVLGMLGLLAARRRTRGTL